MPFYLLLGSTSGYLPALAYASDRHVTDVISVKCPVSPVICLQCVCHIDLLHPNIHKNFIWIIMMINVNPLDIINNYLILPIFCRALIYY